MFWIYLILVIIAGFRVTYYFYVKMDDDEAGLMFYYSMIGLVAVSLIGRYLFPV
jgi:formate-dependent nitrite reductase membrane component NrfD